MSTLEIHEGAVPSYLPKPPGLQHSHEYGNPGWNVAPLADVVDILDSRRVPINGKEREQRLGNVPYYGATGQVGWIDEHIFDEELVLLGEDGAPFLDVARPKAYLIQGKSWVNNHAHVLRAKQGLLNSFLLYQLNRLDYRPYVSGTTRLKLPQRPMRRIPIVVPPLEEQRRIVAELETQLTRLDASVAALKRTQAKLKRYRASVLKAACNGRLLSGRLRPAGSAAMTIYAPQLPDGWSFATVGDLAITVQFGSSAKTSERDGGIPVLRMGNIVDGSIDLSDLKYLPINHHEFPNLLLEPGDLLFNRTNSSDLVGKTAVYAGQPEKCSFASYLIRVRLSKRCLPKYLSYYINSVFGRTWIRSVVNQQVGQANVNGTKLKALMVPLPPLVVQRRIVAEVERRLSVVEELEATVAANLKRVERLRQSLLGQAFSG